MTVIVESGDKYIYGSPRFANVCVVSVNKDNCPHISGLLTAAVTQLLALVVGFYLFAINNSYVSQS